MTTPRSPHLILVVVLLVLAAAQAFLILGLWGLGNAPVDFHDYRVYHRLGLNVLERRVFSMDEAPPYVPTTWRSPGYPALIALIYGIAGERPIAVRISQFLFVALTAYLLFVFARRYVGEGAAIIAAVLCGVYPPLVFHAPFHVDETPSTCLAVGLMAGLFALRGEPGTRTWPFILMGIGMGAQTLIRPSFLPLILVVSAVLLLDLGRPGVLRRLVPVGGLMLAYCAVVGPWVVRNSLLAGQPANVHTGGGWQLYVSMQQYAGEVSYRMLKPEWEEVVAAFNARTREAERTLISSEGAGVTASTSFKARVEVTQDRKAVKDALEKARSLSLTQVLRSVPERLFWLWSTADASPWRTGGLHRFQQILHVALALLVVWGIYLARSNLRAHGLVWLLPAYFTALHLVFAVESRYSLPARPFLLIYAGLALHYAATRSLRLLSRRPVVPSRDVRAT